MTRLANIISTSGDDEFPIIWIVLIVLGSILTISGMSDITKINEKKREEERKTREKAKIAAAIANASVTKEAPKKCFFCGEDMDAGQVFCGKCGRRQD